MKFTRHFTKPNLPIADQITWKIAESKITKANGEVIFHMENIEVPSHWSQQAVNILAQKYFRKAGVPSFTFHNPQNNFTHPKWLSPSLPDSECKFGSETSAKQVFHRLAGAWTYWGWKEGIFQDIDGVAKDTIRQYENSENYAQIFYDEIYFMLAHQFAAPNSPQWFNTGLHWAYGITGDANGQWICDENGSRETSNSYEHPQPHACFIQPISDNLVESGGIFDLLKKEALLFKHGSGTGTNFSNLRAKGEKLAGGGVSSGLMSFLKIFDTAAGAISSGGTTRRAAKMICLDLDHPEIEEFINWKMTEEAKAASLYVGSGVLHNIYNLAPQFKDLIPQAMFDRADTGIDVDICGLEFEGPAINTVSAQNANDSIRIINHFLENVDKDEIWNLISRSKKDGRTQVVKTLKAKSLWSQICLAAWACGDPGLQFHDTINEWHTCKNDGIINASNPCSEYMFLDDTACNLASLNLGKFLKNSEFQIKDFTHATRLWTIVLEISVYMASFPSREIAQNSYAYRTLGLGYANLGGILMRLGLSYDSDSGRNLAAAITALLHGQSYLTSQELADELSPFPRWEANQVCMSDVIKKHRQAMRDIYNNATSNSNLLAEGIKIWNRIKSNHHFRNAQVTLLAPTGTIALLMDCDTTGIEPDFSLIKYKNLSGGGVMQIVNECIPEALKNLSYTPAQIQSMLQHIDTYGNLEDYVVNGQHLPEEHLCVFDCANPSGTGKRYLRPMSHVLMMAAVQPFLSGAISKTCNLPNSATIQDVDYIYRSAHRLGLKAIAIYRDGSKLTQPLSSKKDKDLTTLFEERMEEKGLVKTIGGPDMTQLKEFFTHPLKIPLDQKTKNENMISNAIKNSPPYPCPDPGQEPIIDKDYWQRSFLTHPPQITNNSSAKELPASSRKQLPFKRSGYAQKVRIDGQSTYLRTGNYEDGKLGEFTIEISREGSTVRALLGAFSKVASIALQFGVPLEQLVKSFVYTKFEPAGLVQDHDNIKMTTSVLDFVFRDLAINYLGQTEFANVIQTEDEIPIYLDLDALKSPLPLHEKTLETEVVAYSPPKPKSLNFTGNSCPNCGHMTLIQTGTCITCTTCAINTGCG